MAIIGLRSVLALIGIVHARVLLARSRDERATWRAKPNSDTSVTEHSGDACPWRRGRAQPPYGRQRVLTYSRYARGKLTQFL